MEVFFQDRRAFVCSIHDYDRIMKIHQSRSRYRGLLKTPEYNDYFEKFIADVLLGQKPGLQILGVENSSKELIIYSFFLFPKGSSCIFLKSGESLYSNNSPMGYNSGIVDLFELSFRLGMKEQIFDFYQMFKINTFVPVMKLYKESYTHRGEPNKSNWLIHKIVDPDSPLETAIERTLLENLPIKLTHPMVIVHASIKQEFRIDYFKDRFSMSESALRKYLLD